MESPTAETTLFMVTTSAGIWQESTIVTRWSSQCPGHPGLDTVAGGASFRGTQRVESLEENVRCE